MLASNVQDVEAERANEKKLMHRFKVQGPSSHMQNCTCPACHRKHLFSPTFTVCTTKNTVMKINPHIPFLHLRVCQ